ncbi:MAG: lipopolysaccharide heptosyltransferase I [Candidatus Sumerlaeia bacterium]
MRLTIKHILIVRLGAIGDVVHTLPALTALRKEFPGVRLSWMVEALSAPLLEGHPHIDHLHVLPYRKKTPWKKYLRALWHTGRELRREGVDVAIDFQGLTKSGLAAWSSGASLRVGFGGAESREWNRFFMNRRVTPGEADVHVIDKNLALLRALGIEKAGRRFVLPDFPRAGERIASWWGGCFGPDERVVMINPGAGWETKRMPLETWRAVAARLSAEVGMRVVVLWGPGERESAEALVRSVNAAAGVDGAALPAPDTTLQELVELTRRAALFLGGDTGPTHIAAALGVPTLSVFGGSDSRRNEPAGPRARSLQNFALSCVPCWKTRCPLTGDRRLACLKTLPPDRIYAEAIRLLNESGAG